MQHRDAAAVSNDPLSTRKAGGTAKPFAGQDRNDPATTSSTRQERTLDRRITGVRTVPTRDGLSERLWSIHGTAWAGHKPTPSVRQIEPTSSRTQRRWRPSDRSRVVPFDPKHADVKPTQGQHVMVLTAARASGSRDRRSTPQMGARAVPQVPGGL